MRKWFNESISKYKELRSVEEICREQKILFCKTPMINCSTTRELFEKADADLGISLGNGYIGQKVFSIPRYGMINIHHEILPAYQNAQSIIWQLYNLSSKTGYTIHKIDKNIDTGAILYQESISIDFMDTLPETIAKTSVSLLEASAKGLLYCLQHFDRLFFKAKPQGEGQSYTTPSIWQYFRIVKNFHSLRKNHKEQVARGAG
jgi:methionyl-tRNA formyltransferase